MLNLDPKGVCHALEFNWNSKEFRISVLLKVRSNYLHSSSFLNPVLNISPLSLAIKNKASTIFTRKSSKEEYFLYLPVHVDI